jgi:hypothetical protein
MYVSFVRARAGVLPALRDLLQQWLLRKWHDLSEQYVCPTGQPDLWAFCSVHCQPVLWKQHDRAVLPPQQPDCMWP